MIRSFSKKLTSSNLYIKVTNWEYWPMEVAYIPVLFMWFYFVIRSKKFFFQSNVNHLHKNGAMMGASKYKILSMFPEPFRPVTIFNPSGENRIAHAEQEIKKFGLSFPLIVKPDLGERGLLVELIHNMDELRQYLQANVIDILIQEYVSLPEECGIFYVRKPSEDKGRIVSIGLKSFLRITGDGKSSIRQLLNENPRSKLQVKRLEKKLGAELDRVLAEGEDMKIEPIGNHNRGTTFLNGNHLISEKLAALFDDINRHLPEFYYGRYDLKYRDWDSLLEGKDIKLLELNGIASEPIHIYDPSIDIMEKYRVFYRHWKTLFEISMMQMERGIRPVTRKNAIKAVRDYYAYVGSVNINWRAGIS